MNKKNLSEILLNLMILALGVCLLLWADKVTTIVSILLGCIGVLYGLILVYNYFKSEEKLAIDTLHFIYGIIILVIGFILIFRVEFVKELISFVVGIYVVLSGILQLQEIFLLKKNNNIQVKGMIILSLIEILIGIMCIVGKFLLPDIMLKFMGVMLVMYSTLRIISLIVTRRKYEKENIIN